MLNRIVDVLTLVGLSIALIMQFVKTLLVREPERLDQQKPDQEIELEDKSTPNNEIYPQLSKIFHKVRR